MHEPRRFEGREVVGVEVRLTRAAVPLDGVERHHVVGDTVHVVVECVIERVGYVRVPKTDRVLRLEHATPFVAALIDADAATDAIDLARQAAEAEHGVQRLRAD